MLVTPSIALQLIQEAPIGLVGRIFCELDLIIPGSRSRSTNLDSRSPQRFHRAASSSVQIGSGSDRERLRENAIRLCKLFENGIMMAIGHLDYFSRKAVCAPRRSKFA